MVELKWRNFTVDDCRALMPNVRKSLRLGSNASPVGLLVLQKKYNIKCASNGSVMFLYYCGNYHRTGYGFPISMYDKINENMLCDCLKILFDDAEKHARRLCFILLSAEEKAVLEECLKKYFPDYAFDMNCTSDDSDYIYERENLASLSGKKYQKKRNHISKFERSYSNFTVKELTIENMNDALEVEEKWLAQRDADNDILTEREEIELLAKNWSNLDCVGAVLYTDGKASAMTIGSPISSKTLDVHFEKAIEPYASNGAYAVINRAFAQMNSSYELFNREEDMGIAGLRKAKLSYNPYMILEKYYGCVVNKADDRRAEIYVCPCMTAEKEIYSNAR